MQITTSTRCHPAQLFQELANAGVPVISCYRMGESTRIEAAEHASATMINSVIAAHSPTGVVPAAKDVITPVADGEYAIADIVSITVTDGIITEITEAE